MKQRIRLTEDDLKKIIKESARRIMREYSREYKIDESIRMAVRHTLNEISDDTIDSAADKALERWQEYLDKYGTNDPRTIKAYNQYEKFKSAWKSSYDKGNNARKARMLQNQEGRRAGKREFVSGKGWRNK